MTDEQAEIHGEESESTTLFIVDMFYRVERERDQWRECATKLAIGIAVEDDEQIDAAIAEFDRMREEGK